MRQRDLHLFGRGRQPRGDTGLELVEELRRAGIGDAALERGRERREHRRADEGRPLRAESLCIPVDLVLRPEPVLGVEHLEVVDLELLEPARRRERSEEVRLLARDHRDAHPVQLVLR